MKATITTTAAAFAAMTGLATASVIPGSSRPLVGSVPYGINILSCTVPGKVALTFDDGPYIYTDKLLDVLASRNAKATFFVCGKYGSGPQINDRTSPYPAVLQRMANEGHQVGSHTYGHADMQGLLDANNRPEFDRQITDNEAVIYDVLGYYPTYFRPPYTSCLDNCMAELGKWGYHIVNYDLDTRDWEGDYAAARTTFQTTVDQSISSTSSWLSLAHDTRQETVNPFALYMVETAQAAGYELVTIGECLGDPKENWYRYGAPTDSN